MNRANAGPYHRRAQSTMSEAEIDLELLQRWRSGDDESGQALFLRHYNDLYRFFDSKIEGDIEDLVHDTFTACVKAKDGFREESAVKTYLFAVARNVLYGHFRKKMSSREEGVDFTTTSVQELGGSLSSLLTDKQQLQLVRLALPRIPLEHQILLELYLWENFTGAALGTIMGIPENTVRAKFRRAKALLEKQMEEIAQDPQQLHQTLVTLSEWIADIQKKAREKFPDLSTS